MRRFWIAVTLFSVLIIVAIVSAVYIKNENLNLLGLLEEAAVEYYTNETTALLKLRDSWNRAAYRYSTFVGNDKIAEIEFMLDELEAVWDKNTPFAVELRVAGIRSKLNAIEQSCFPNLQNIL